jgi:hypothetical protein
MTTNRMQRRVEAQRSIVRSRAALCSIQTWMETAINITEDQADYLDSLAQVIVSGAKWLDTGVTDEAALPTLPTVKPEPAIPDFLKRRDERRRALDTPLDWRNKAPLIPQEKPDTIRGVAI